MNLANFITLGNILAGLASIALSLKTRALLAAHFIFLGMVLDILDGKIARMTNSSNSLGKYLDSTADFITFGVAPVFLIGFHYPVAGQKLIVPALAVYVLCSVLRLVRFAVAAKSQSRGFVGLPVPAAAGCLISFVLIFYIENREVPAFPLIALIGANALLMVSTIPYEHFSNTLNRLPVIYKRMILLFNFVFFLMGKFYILLFLQFFAYIIYNFVVQISLSKNPFLVKS